MSPAAMSPVTAALHVARWEFLRYFKLRQQLIGLLIMAMAGGGVWGVMRLSEGSAPPVADVAVVSAPAIPLPDEQGGFRFTRGTEDALGRLLPALERGEIDGVLRLNADYSGELTVQRESGWIPGLQETLTALRREAVLEREGISASTWQDVRTPAVLDVVAREGARRGGVLSFMVAGVLMLLAIMAAMGTIFASITGEKQLRVTEQVLSAISPQAWMDGKILGIAAVSLTSVLITAGGFVLLALVLHLAGVGIPVPLALGNVGTLIYLTLFAVAGLFFWLSFLAAVAAIIDDPQTSTRGAMLMLPMLSSGLAFLALRDADSTLVRVLALLPPTAPTAMPARLILGDVRPLEPMLALVLLAAAAVLMRLAAGRIFRTAMLMYGKEPSWREIRRWVVER